MKRFIAILLAMLLALPFGFAVAGADGESPRITEDIWTEINALEESKLLSRKNADPTAKDFVKLTDEVQRLVLAWDGYVEGSLVRNGDVLFWDGCDGVGYGYLPHQREKIYKTKTVSVSEAENTSEPKTLRGGRPGSNDIAVFQPYYGLDLDVTSDRYANEGESIAETTCGRCFVYRQNDATIDAIADALESCGVVFLDSHGETDSWLDDATWYGDSTSHANTSYICLQSGVGLTAEDQQTVQGPYGEYKHAFYAGSYQNIQFYDVDGTAIANHMEQNAPNSFLWMAFCFGMATDGLEAPLHAKGVEVVYGYSQLVSVDWDFNVEAAFWNEMKNGKTVADAALNMKEQCGVYDVLPWATIPAYPIFVSSEDEYPGKGDVDAEQEVHSEWTLFSNDLPTHEDDWGFTRFEWTNTNNGQYEAYAVYTCAICGEETEVEATVTQLSHGIVSEFEAAIRADEAPDGEERKDTMKVLPAFGGFEWDTNNGVKAYAIYVCNVFGCYDHQYRVQATVTRVNPHTVVPKYKAVVTAEQAPDGVERTETKTVVKVIDSKWKKVTPIKPFDPIVKPITPRLP